MTRLRIWIARRLLGVALWVTPHGQRAFVSRGRGRPMVTQPKMRRPRYPDAVDITRRPEPTLPPHEVTP